LLNFLFCLNFIHVFIFFIFVSFCITILMVKFFNEALESLHGRQLLTWQECYGKTETTTPSTSTGNGSKLSFQLCPFSESKVHKPIDMSNNNLATSLLSSSLCLPFQAPELLFTLMRFSLLFFVFHFVFIPRIFIFAHSAVLHNFHIVCFGPSSSEKFPFNYLGVSRETQEFTKCGGFYGNFKICTEHDYNEQTNIWRPLRP